MSANDRSELDTDDDPAGEPRFEWGEIEGVPIEFPMTVDRMNAATLSWTVPSGPAGELIPGDAFTVAETGPGTATFVMALVDYLENPWGDYLEVNLGVLAHPVGDPDSVGAFVYRMPVDQHFTMVAGNDVLGLPKTVEDLRFDYTNERIEVGLRMADQHTLTVSFPRVGPMGDNELIRATTYSYLDGRPTALPLAIELGTGLIDPAEVTVSLGTGPVSDELRRLGLPSAPDFALWGEGLRGIFGRPRQI
jgi:hypothetical protein